MSHLHPGFLLFATAILASLTRGVWRQLVVLAGTAFALYSAWYLGFDTTLTFAIPGYTLELLRVDALSHIFGLIFSLIAGIGCLYALHVHHGGEHVAALIYAGTALGVVFAGDLITLFVFWELMAVSSLFVIWYGNTARAQAAGLRYLIVHAFGGSLLLCGMLIHMAAGGDLTVQALASTTPGAAFWLILIGVAINAAIPPLHAWLTDAYPEASVSGSVFLSAFTTKTAVYVLIRLFPGTSILLWFGVIMTLYGVVYAVLANDIRNLLAYHIVSQVGYMVAGVGMGSALALNGSVAHAFCHILYKALLFMGAGSVIYATDKRKLTELGGLARAMPLVLVLYMVGAVSISGFPLFNGFISKSIIISVAAQEHLPIAELMLTLASIGTFLSIGLKLPYFTFFGSDRDLQPHRVRSNMLLAMGIAAICCAALGIFPDWLYVRLPFDATYHPYTVDHVVSSLQLFLGTSLGFWWMLAKLKSETAIAIDTDWIYRKPLRPAFDRVVSLSQQAGAALEAMRLSLNRFLTPYLRNPFRLFMQFGLPPPPPNSTSQPPMAYNENTYRLPIGATVLWIVVCFSLAVLYLLI
jgi:multicomponent Na+:H+ antiporter subunit D